MIDWNYLINKYGSTKTPHIFEEISLAFVRDIYPQYSWYPTGKTRDGNKDAQRKEVFFGEDNSFDVWEEAKFKGTHLPLRRQDIDPTILSGLIQGNVRLIVFVTNTRVPDELVDRAIIGARIKGMKVSCVLSDQLESWLILHPDVYEKYWDNCPTPKETVVNIVSIQSATFFDMVSNDFSAFCVRKNMLTGCIYLLTFSISSNNPTSAKLLTDIDFPFEIVQHPNYDDPDHLNIECGLNTFAILLKTKCIFSGGVNLRFEINNVQYSRVTPEIEISENHAVDIVYAQQLQLIGQMESFIKMLPDGTTGNIISLYAESGMGKSFLLKSIYESFGLKRDMTIVCFESDKNALTNYQFLCRITLFLYYGNIFWDRKSWSNEEVEQHKAFAIQNNPKDLFDNSSLGQLFDGCFDASIAKDVIEKLTRRKRNAQSLIHTRSVLAGKILLLDDFQYLNKVQAEYIYHIIDDLNKYQSDCVLIISATKGRFKDKQAQTRFLNITPNTYELNGLSNNDMAETLGICFRLSPRALYHVAHKILSPSPLLTCELLRALREEVGETSDNIVKLICTYSASKGKAHILKNRFAGLKKQYYLLDILYRFKKGMPEKILMGFDGFGDRPVREDLSLLLCKRLVISQEGRIFPYHDYYVRSYIQLRKANYCNSFTGRFLSYLINIPDYEKLFDANQVLSMLIGCGKKYLRLYEHKVKEKIQNYMSATQFGAALHYCSCLYRMMEGRNPDTYSHEEFQYIFAYAYCLVHCGDQHLANHLLDMIYTSAKENVPEKYAAGAELLNQNFWSFKPETIIKNSFLIQSGSAHMLQAGNLSASGLARVEQAYDACFNRRMVTYLLLDQWENGKTTYAERLRLLANEFQGDDFRSRAATLIMDYARGISFIAPKLAKRLLEIAFNYFSCQEETHYRRILLCKIDILVLRCIAGEPDALWEMEPIIEDLLQEGFRSEYFKAILKRCACRSVFMSHTAVDSVSRTVPLVPDATQAEDSIEEISNALLESGLQPGTRDLFLLNNLMAFFSICDGEYQKADEYLQTLTLYVRNAGESYRRIVAHNLCHINTISRIAWCTKDTPFDPNTFLLDCRFW